MQIFIFVLRINIVMCYIRDITNKHVSAKVAKMKTIATIKRDNGLIEEVDVTDRPGFTIMEFRFTKPKLKKNGSGDLLKITSVFESEKDVVNTLYKDFNDLYSEGYDGFNPHNHRLGTIKTIATCVATDRGIKRTDVEIEGTFKSEKEIDQEKRLKQKKQLLKNHTCGINKINKPPVGGEYKEKMR